MILKSHFDPESIVSLTSALSNVGLVNLLEECVVLLQLSLREWLHFLVRENLVVDGVGGFVGDHATASCFTC